MADSQIDYSVVLADLKAKRDQIDGAIAAIEAMLGLTASMPANARPGAPTGAGELGPGAFLGMSIVDATVKLLAIRRQQQRTEDIVAALKQGGIAFSSENPTNTVGSILNRNYSQGGEIVRVSRGVWGLAEWHPRLCKRKVNGSATTEVSGNEGESDDAEENIEPGSTDNPAELG